LGHWLDMDLEIYHKKTVDLLSELDVSRTTGDTRVWRNLGTTENKGVELTIESVNVRKPRFQWTTSANISHNRNRLLELAYGIPKTREDQIWMEGQDLGTY